MTFVNVSDRDVGIDDMLLLKEYQPYRHSSVAEETDLCIRSTHLDDYAGSYNDRASSAITINLPSIDSLDRGNDNNSITRLSADTRQILPPLQNDVVERGAQHSDTFKSYHLMFSDRDYQNVPQNRLKSSGENPSSVPVDLSRVEGFDPTASTRDCFIEYPSPRPRFETKEVDFKRVEVPVDGDQQLQHGDKLAYICDDVLIPPLEYSCSSNSASSVAKSDVNTDQYSAFKALSPSTSPFAEELNKNDKQGPVSLLRDLLVVGKPNKSPQESTNNEEVSFTTCLQLLYT